MCPGALVGQKPAGVVALELQHRVGLEHLGDERGDARAADHRQVVAVEVHVAPELDVLDLGAELEVAGEVGQSVEGGEVFLRDCGSACTRASTHYRLGGHGFAMLIPEATFPAAPSKYSYPPPRPQ